jgi:xanthine/uracil/vitamin C permease (AzgA family)
MSPQVILILCLTPFYAFLVWAAFMGIKAEMTYLHEDTAKLSAAQRHRAIGLVVAFFGVQAALILLVWAVSGNLFAGVVAVTILVLLMRYIGLARSSRRSGEKEPPADTSPPRRPRSTYPNHDGAG